MRIKQVLYYQQGGKCFYCNKQLSLAEATLIMSSRKAWEAAAVKIT